MYYLLYYYKEDYDIYLCTEGSTLLMYNAAASHILLMMWAAHSIGNVVIRPILMDGYIPCSVFMIVGESA